MSFPVLYALVRRLAEAGLAPRIVGPLKSTEIRYKGAGADLALEKDNFERDLGSQSLHACHSIQRAIVLNPTHVVGGIAHNES
jgi:hypothetical protein